MKALAVRVNKTNGSETIRPVSARPSNVRFFRCAGQKCTKGWKDKKYSFNHSQGVLFFCFTKIIIAYSYLYIYKHKSNLLNVIYCWTPQKNHKKRFADFSVRSAHHLNFNFLCIWLHCKSGNEATGGIFLLSSAAVDFIFISQMKSFRQLTFFCN